MVCSSIRNGLFIFVPLCLFAVQSAKRQFHRYTFILYIIVIYFELFTLKNRLILQHFSGLMW